MPALPFRAPCNRQVCRASILAQSLCRQRVLALAACCLRPSLRRGTQEASLDLPASSWQLARAPLCPSPLQTGLSNLEACPSDAHALCHASAASPLALSATCSGTDIRVCCSFQQHPCQALRASLPGQRRVPAQHVLCCQALCAQGRTPGFHQLRSGATAKLRKLGCHLELTAVRACRPLLLAGR